VPVHVLARVAGQLLTDLERNIGIGHRRIEATVFPQGAKMALGMLN